MPVYQSEKKGKLKALLTRCSACNIIVLKLTFSRHRAKCLLSTNKPVESVPTTLLEVPSFATYNSGFTKYILGKFRNDKIGHICRTDEAILAVGAKCFWKLHRKEDKATEVYRSLRSDMRGLANLYTYFKEQEGVMCVHSNSLDMFNRVNFQQLSNTIDIHTRNDDNSLKAGLKCNLYYLIKKAAVVLQYSFYSQAKDEEVSEMSKFIQSFKSWNDYLFGDATYQLNKQRQINLRKPCRLPLEEDLVKLRNDLLGRMEHICSESILMIHPAILNCEMLFAPVSL